MITARPAAGLGSAIPGIAIAATLGLAAASWVVAVRDMRAMNMGVATSLGSLGFFLALWVWMMAAMMLPGAAPAAARRARAAGLSTLPLFVGSYLGVWALAGAVVYALYRPHGTVAAGVVTVAAGVYELTPLKRYFRRRCHDSACPGYEFGLYCAGSSTGLMAMLVMLGVMSVIWMLVVAAIVLAQKLLPARAAVDVPLALAICGLGVLVITAPATIPGLLPPM